MSTKKERNLLYAELENLSDCITRYDTHKRYLNNVLMRYKKSLENIVFELKNEETNPYTMADFIQTLEESLDAFVLCNNDIRETYFSEKKILDMLAMDAEFLKKTYSLLNENG